MSNKKTAKCIDCGIPVWVRTVRCRNCAAKTHRGPNYENNLLKSFKVIHTGKKKNKRVPVFCIDCSNPIGFYSKRCKSCANKGSLNQFYGKVHDKRVTDIISRTNKGKWEGANNPRVSNPLIRELNPNWKGGTSLGVIYPYKFKKKMRPLILKVYTNCQWCSSVDNLVVHHIDHDIQNNEFVNLITLCRGCNISEIHDLRPTKFYYFRRITENMYQHLYLGASDPIIDNRYPGVNIDTYNKLKSYEISSIANKGVEWGVLRT